MACEYYQLDFFKDDEICRLESEIQACKESSNKVRKRLFAENGSLKKIIADLEQRLVIIEKNLCTADVELDEFKKQL